MENCEKLSLGELKRRAKEALGSSSKKTKRDPRVEDKTELWSSAESFEFMKKYTKNFKEQLFLIVDEEREDILSFDGEWQVVSDESGKLLNRNETMEAIERNEEVMQATNQCEDSPNLVHWSRCEDGGFKINIDAAFGNTNKPSRLGRRDAAGGLILRKGNVFAFAFSIYFGESVGKSEEGEASMLLIALKFLKEVKLMVNVTIETDCQRLVILLGNIEALEDVSSKTKKIMKEVIELRGELLNEGYCFSVKFHYREANEAADLICKYGREVRKTIIWRNQPQFLDKTIFEDAREIRRVRPA